METMKHDVEYYTVTVTEKVNHIIQLKKKNSENLKK